MMTNSFLTIFLILCTFCCTFEAGFVENLKPLEFRSFETSNDSPRKIILWSSSSTIEKTKPNEDSSTVLKADDESRSDKLIFNFVPKQSNAIIKQTNIKDTVEINNNEDKTNQIDENLMNDINYYHYDAIPNDEQKILEEKTNHIKKLNDETPRIVRLDNGEDNMKRKLSSQSKLPSRQPTIPFNMLDTLLHPFNFAFFLMHQLNRNMIPRLNEPRTQVKEIKEIEPITSESKTDEIIDDDNEYDSISSLKIVYDKPDLLSMIKNKKNDNKKQMVIKKVPIFVRAPRPLFKTYAIRLPSKMEIMEENIITEAPATEAPSTVKQEEITQPPCNCKSEVITETPSCNCNGNSQIQTVISQSNPNEALKKVSKNKKFPKLVLFIQKNK